MKKNVLRFLGLFLITVVAFWRQEVDALVTCVYTSNDMPDIIVNYEPDSSADSLTLNPDVSFNYVKTEDYILYYRIIDRANDANKEWYVSSRTTHNWVPQHLLPLSKVEKEAMSFISYDSWVAQKDCFPDLQFYYNPDYSAVIFTREGLGTNEEYSDFLAEENEYSFYKLQSFVDTDLAGDESNTSEPITNTYKKVQCGDTKIPKLAATLVRTVYIVLQIAVPVIIVILGSLDFLKATIAQKEDEMKKYQQVFIRRLILGAAVFLIFALVQLVIGIVAPHNDNPGMWDCVDCLINGDCK